MELTRPEVNPRDDHNPRNGANTCLAQTATQMTSIIQADRHNLGARIEAIKKKAKHSIARANQYIARIQDPQDQLESAHEKIDDLENRTRRYNFRIRGLTESIKDPSEAVRALIKDLFPNIPEHHLEIERAHRVQQPPC